MNINSNALFPFLAKFFFLIWIVFIPMKTSVYLALSCLQGRPMQAAAAKLWELGPDGLQLNPGNAPTPGFAAWLDQAGIPSLSHHGFSWQALRQNVWSHSGRCRVGTGSAHPPQAHEPAASHW